MRDEFVELGHQLGFGRSERGLGLGQTRISRSSLLITRGPLSAGRRHPRFAAFTPSQLARRVKGGGAGWPGEAPASESEMVGMQ